MASRMQLLKEHTNDYGFDVTRSLPLGQLPLKLSIVIPYYNTGHIFSRCLHFLSHAINILAEKVEVIVVDDGSELLAASEFIGSYIEGLTLIKHSANKGRTEARNTGIQNAKGDIILFLDSDVLIDSKLLKNHLDLHQIAMQRNKNSIIISFFEFTDKLDYRIEKNNLVENDLEINDFRINCEYGETWIGCDEDKKFIGQRMQIVKETNYLRGWKGQYKAWMLPNMILGGAFSAQRSEIIAVGCFDSRFTGYGFTETSAVTRMIAERNNVVIPSINGGALHIEDELTNVPRDKKDEIFKQKHDFYFNVFLQEEINI